jgi:hypothetical protein
LTGGGSGESINRVDGPQNPDTAPLRRWTVFLQTTFGIVLLAVRASRYWPFFSDDALILMEAYRWINRHISSFPGMIILGLMTVAGLVSFVRHQDACPENQQAIDERFEFNGQVIGLMLKKGFGRFQPVVAVSASGCIPYWSELPSIDMLGLNDHYLPRHPPENFGQGWIGHELRDDNYIFSRQPDLVIFHTGSG